MSEYDVFEVAKWFLSKEPMSPKKLQKMLYYAYAWTLVFHNESDDDLSNKLFDEPIEAWVHGPVIGKVYREYKPYGYREITDIPSEKPVFTEEIEDTLEQVWEAYGDLNGNELEAITHKELPWKEAREGLSPLDASNNTLKDRTIFNYYLNEMVES